MVRTGCSLGKDVETKHGEREGGREEVGRGDKAR